MRVHSAATPRGSGGGCEPIFRNNVAAAERSVRVGLKQWSHDNLLLLVPQSSEIPCSRGSRQSALPSPLPPLHIHLGSAGAMLPRKARWWTANFCTMDPLALCGSTGRDAFWTCRTFAPPGSERIAKEHRSLRVWAGNCWMVEHGGRKPGGRRAPFSHPRHFSLKCEHVFRRRLWELSTRPAACSSGGRWRSPRAAR